MELQIGPFLPSTSKQAFLSLPTMTSYVHSTMGLVMETRLFIVFCVLYVALDMRDGASQVCLLFRVAVQTMWFGRSSFIHSVASVVCSHPSLSRLVSVHGVELQVAKCFCVMGYLVPKINTTEQGTYCVPLV